MGIKPSILLANPIPTVDSIAKDRMDQIIGKAIQDAEIAGATGHRNTPFVLKRVRELSEGMTVVANRSLVEANVLRGTRLAVEYEILQRENVADQ